MKNLLSIFIILAIIGSGPAFARGGHGGGHGHGFHHSGSKHHHKN